MELEFFVSIFIMLLFGEAQALRMLNITVPPFVRKGDTAELKCRYDLEGDTLNSVLWIKDNEQIFRYDKKMGTNVYNADDINIDINRSTDQVLLLHAVDLNAAGLYKCEVNTDKPDFKSMHLQAVMEVLDLPKEKPKITGEDEIYANSDVLALNCTSGFSHPPATLQWFINDIPVDSNAEETIQSNFHGTSQKHSNLLYSLNPAEIRDKKIRVKCTSTIKISSGSTTYFKDVRDTEIYVVGHASLLKCFSIVSLLAVSLMLILHVH